MLYRSDVITHARGSLGHDEQWVKTRAVMRRWRSKPDLYYSQEGERAESPKRVSGVEPFTLSSPGPQGIKKLVPPNPENVNAAAISED